MIHKKFKAIDLFAGIGGIRIGFEAAGFETIYSNDFDKKAAETYRLNFGEIDTSNLFEVIKERGMKRIPRRFDILLGGPSTIVVHGKTPALKAPEDDPVSADVDNAIALYEYYRNLDETQASDPRLWVYLSHVEFRKYCLVRWGLKGSLKDLKDGDEKIKATNYLLEHWFISGNDRDLRRHAIARLWWAARLTYAPWESDPEYFGDLKNKDPYYYTRVLFLTQDIYQQVLERAMGRSNHILISVLDYFGKNSEFAESREKVRSLMKELNLAYGTKKIITLDRKSLDLLIAKIASEIGADKSQHS